MADLASSVDVLRKRFRYFLADQALSKASRRRLMERLHLKDWNACVFGGTLRDIAIRGPYTRTRDIDIVIENVSADEIVDAVAEWPARRNSFGGVHVNVDGDHFDLWPLHETWAWKSMGLGAPGSLYATFEQLPRTTFLTVESIAVSLRPQGNAGRLVYEHKFFESMRTKVVELNRAENPYPALCIARALTTAMRLDFRLGPKLVAFIVQAFEKVTPKQIVDAQWRHYHRVYYDEWTLSAIHRRLCDSLMQHPEACISVPPCQQLTFSFYEPEPMERFLAESDEPLRT